ncbi:fructokinase [Corynebacterium glucuronolyticum ATCC 51867]|nr:fructokinase [Corynebacterium glucuronolyticum ATCC 51867]
MVVEFPVFLNKERTRVKYPRPVISGGGTAANTAVALAKLGVNTGFLGTVGDDQYGNFIARTLKDNGVDTSGLHVDPETCTVCVFAFVDERGERYLWGWPREHQSFKKLDLTESDVSQIESSKWIHASGMSMSFPSPMRTTMQEIFDIANRCEVTTSFDMNSRCDDRDLDRGFRESLFGVIGKTNFLLGSGPEEFSTLGGGSWQENAREMSAENRIVIPRDGGNGAYAYSSNGVCNAPAFNVPVVDTIGAGDVFNAGFIFSYLQNGDLDRALLVANAVSAISLMHKGSQASPNREELNDFLKQHKYR